MKKHFIFLLIFFIFVLFHSFVYAQSVLDRPTHIGYGARPIGMGKAFVALADDANAIFMNPAGLGKLKSFKFTGMVGSFQGAEEVGYYTLGFAGPGIGIGLVGTTFPSLPNSPITGNGLPSFTPFYTDYTGGLAVIAFGGQPFTGFSLGIGAKIYYQQLTDDAGISETAQGSGLDLDVGIIIDPVPWGSIGVTATNVIEFDSGGKFIWLPNPPYTADPEEEDIPLFYKAGIAVRILGKDGLAKAGNQKLVFALDTEMYPEETMPVPNVWYAGLEYTPIKNIAVRLGIDQVLIAGLEIQNNMTAGLGFNFAGYTLDYAYHQYGEETDGVSHYITLGFVGEEEEEDVKEVEETVITEIPTEEAKEITAIEPESLEKFKKKSFIDVPQGYWAKDAIESLAGLGILGGYPDGTFKPEGKLTRAEFATILVRARDVDPPAVTVPPFPDVPSNHWAAKFVKMATILQLVSGYPDGTYGPNKSITRAEGLVVVSRFANISPKENQTLRAFPDLPIDHWAAPAVWGSYEKGMLDYLAGGNFEPNKTLTRAEVAEILSRTPWGKEKIENFVE